MSCSGLQRYLAQRSNEEGSDAWSGELRRDLIAFLLAVLLRLALSYAEER